MKKIIVSAFFVLISNLFCQFQYFDIGVTTIKDSTGYTTFNRSVLVNHNLFVRGYINLDSLAKGKIYYVGNELTFEQSKNGGFTFTNSGENAGFNINLGEKNSFFTITKLSGGVGIPIITIDSTGVNIESGMTYKIGGVPITAGSLNLYGYMHKDTAFIHNQHLRTKTFTIWAGSTDSVRFTVKGTAGDLMVTPVGDNITFGSSFGTGTKNVYAGAYYIGDSLLTNKTLVMSKVFTAPFINALTGYQLNGADISWGVSSISRTGLTINLTSSYANYDSLTLAAGTYQLTYTAQVNFLSGSGSTLTDYAYIDIYNGSTVSQSEIYTGHSYTTAGVNGDFRTIAWNVTVTPSVSTKYYFRMKEISNTGLNVKLKGYVFTAAKVK